MATLKWHDGKNWNTIYEKEIGDIDDRITALENLHLSLPASNAIREDITTHIIGSSNQLMPTKAESSEVDMHWLDAIRLLVKYSHRHKVINSTQQLTRLCQCQCQCQCQC